MDVMDVDDPSVGMMFDSLECGWEYWKNYGEKMGFRVRKEYSNKSRIDKLIINAVYVCCKHGLKKEKHPQKGVVTQQRCDVRTDCKVMFKLGLDRVTGKYRVKEFITAHNHDLEPNETIHMLRSHREINISQALAIELASDSGITPKTTQELSSREAGGRSNLGFLLEDQKTYLRSMRQKEMVNGELEGILRYFEQQNSKNASFYYSFQLDSDDLVTNIFWADSKMLADYADFGDVVTFDTTFGTNREFRPLGVFTGFNNHRKIVILGATLLYDETIESFLWLFETFVKAHGGKRPRTIFTDQDATIGNALATRWPDTYHGLCTWHIMQNGIKHLGGHMKNNNVGFLKEFKRCMFDYLDEVEFEVNWQKMLNDFDLKENKWLGRIYALKEKWAKCCMKNTMTLGRQLSESFNSDLKDHLKSDLNISCFFKHFDRVLEQKRNNELEVEFFARQKVPTLGLSRSPLLKQASQIYTPSIFKLFHEEFNLASMALIKKEDQNKHEYIVAFHDTKEKEFKVFCDPSLNVANCNCMKFETMGILCCHVLKVFGRLDIMEIPKMYILDRWTRGVKGKRVSNEVSSSTEENVSDWVCRIQSYLLRMTFQASLNKDTRANMERFIDEYTRLHQEVIMNNDSTPQEALKQNIVLQIGNMKGLKKKEGRKGSKRMKPLHEIRIGKAKRTNTSSSKGDNTSFNVAGEGVCNVNVPFQPPKQAHPGEGLSLSLSSESYDFVEGTTLPFGLM